MSISRRKFLETSALTAAGALAMSASSYARVIGANDRVNLGFMGTNSRGWGLIDSFSMDGNINITHLCDVDSRVVEKTSAKIKGLGHDNLTTNSDIRKTLESSDLDALVIAAPDHWHATAGVMALQADKHVYVEKPLSQNPHEGEIFIEAQKKYGKVVQMGNQQRSSVETIELVEMIRNGVIGKAYRAETWYGNGRGTIGNGKVADVPDWLNWEMWQGPANRTEYRDNLVHYNWHWFWQWGTGELCNNACHELDIARWALDVEFPTKVSVTGSREHFEGDDWEMYDTIDARYDYEGGKSISWIGNSCNRIRRFNRERGTIIMGSKGYAIVDREGYEIYDSNGKMFKQAIVKGAQVSSSGDLMGGGVLTDNHAINFLNVVRGTAAKQNSTIEIGHTSTMMCHIGNIAYRIGEDIECDPNTGKVKGRKANALWGREFASGWDIKA